MSDSEADDHVTGVQLVDRQVNLRSQISDLKIEQQPQIGLKTLVPAVLVHHSSSCEGIAESDAPRATVEACGTVGGSLVRRSLVRRRNEVYHTNGEVPRSIGCKKVGRQACPADMSRRSSASEGGT